MKRAFAEYLLATHRIDESALRGVPCEGPVSREPVGRLALLHGLLNGRDIDRILSRQAQDQRFFGEIAQDMGLLSRAQVEVLLAGQKVRAGVELIEDLALLGKIDVAEGLRALSEYIASEGFAQTLAADAAARAP